MKGSAGLVLSLLFLSGCDGSSTDPTTPPTTPSVLEARTEDSWGFDGVDRLTFQVR